MPDAKPARDWIGQYAQSHQHPVNRLRWWFAKIRGKA